MTKLSAIVDINKNILAIVPVTTQISKSGKTKSFPHDIKFVQFTLDNILIDIPKYVNNKYGGDKGHITQEKFNLKEKKISITTPKRKNQKSKNSKKEIKILCKRYRAENGLCDIKSKNRIMVRKDKKLSAIIFCFIADDLSLTD